MVRSLIKCKGKEFSQPMDLNYARKKKIVSSESM